MKHILFITVFLSFIMNIYCQQLFPDLTDKTIYRNRHELYAGGGVGMFPTHYNISLGYLYFDSKNQYWEYNSYSVLPIATKINLSYGVTVNYSYYTAGLMGIGGQPHSDPDKGMWPELIEYMNNTYGTDRYRDSISSNYHYCSINYVLDFGAKHTMFQFGLGYYNYKTSMLFKQEYTGEIKKLDGIYFAINIQYPFYIELNNTDNDRIKIAFGGDMFFPLDMRGLSDAGQVSFGIQLYYCKNIFF